MSDTRNEQKQEWNSAISAQPVEVQNREATVGTVARSSERTLDPNKAFLWRIFKRDTATPELWQEVGSIPARYAYHFSEVQTLGEAHGPGEFLLTCDDRAEFVEIVQEATFSRRAEDEA